MKLVRAHSFAGKAFAAFAIATVVVGAVSACATAAPETNAKAATAASASASASASKPPKHGATRRTVDGASFEAYIASENKWVDPETFLAADKAGRAPNKWPDADVFPPYAETKEHDTMLLNTPDGPCEMYFFHTRWRRRADVRAFGNELRTYKACGTVFTRKIGFADRPAAAPAATTP